MHLVTFDTHLILHLLSAGPMPVLWERTWGEWQLPTQPLQPRVFRTEERLSKQLCECWLTQGTLILLVFARLLSLKVSKFRDNHTDADRAADDVSCVWWAAALLFLSCMWLKWKRNNECCVSEEKLQKEPILYVTPPAMCQLYSSAKNFLVLHPSINKTITYRRIKYKKTFITCGRIHICQILS